MSACSAITDTLTADRCRRDRLLSAVEGSGRAVDWFRIESETNAFRAPMERHFVFEEEMPFPPLGTVSPLSTGSTEMMRQQHAQIRHAVSVHLLLGLGVGLLAAVNASAEPRQSASS